MDLEALIERPPPGYIVVRRQRGDYVEFTIHPVGFAWGDGPWQNDLAETDELSQGPSDELETQSSDGLSGEGIKVSPGITQAARQAGTTGEQDREPNAAGSEPTETPIGTRTRGRLGRFVRRARSMGRYPFSVAVEAYLERIRPEPPFNSGYAPATFKEKSAKLRMLARLFNSWRDDGLVRTADPLKMGEPEINFLLRHF